MDRNIKHKIAFMYYSCNMTQEQIASRLSLTRQKVNSVIGSLKSDGIVAISICKGDDTASEREAVIEERFGLKRVIISPSYGEPELDFLKLANTAAGYIESTVSNGDIVGVSWGRTLCSAVREMRFQNKKDCCVVQLLGAQTMDGLGAKSDDIVRSLAEKLNCGSYLLYAPMVVSSGELKRLLIKERPIQKSLDAMKKCNIALFGIGGIDRNAAMHRMGYLSDSDIERLMAEGFLADIALNPIRADGSTDGCFLSDRLLNADIECIRSIENTVGIAAGIGKADAVIAALRSQLLKTLIIDSALADEIILKTQ